MRWRGVASLELERAPTGTRSFAFLIPTRRPALGEVEREAHIIPLPKRPLLEFISDDGSAVSVTEATRRMGQLCPSSTPTDRAANTTPAGDLKQHNSQWQGGWMAKNMLASLTVGRHAPVLRR